MTNPCSLTLSKQLYEAGLRIETEKWWIPEIFSDETPIVSDILRVDSTEKKKRKWQLENINEGLSNGYGVFAPSTNELLEILFSTDISRIGLSINSAWDDSAVQIIPKCFYGEIPEALGKMALYLLTEGGYKFNSQKGRVEK